MGAFSKSWGNGGSRRTLYQAGQTGKVYYISPTGNNANVGSATLPFLTFVYAETKVAAGDTVIVENGTYTGSGNALYLYNVRSGVSGKPITWIARNTGLAVLDGAGARDYGIVSHASYVNVIGFEIKNTNSHGVLLHPDGGYSNYRDLHIHDIGRIRTVTETGLCAYGLNQTQFITIERNKIHDIGRLGQGELGADYSAEATDELRNYWKGHDHGIYASGTTNLVVRNNIFYNMLRGFSVQLYSGSELPSFNTYIVNNTCENGNPYEYNGHVIIAATVDGCLVANNIFQTQFGAAIQVSTNVTHVMSNVLITKNITYGGNGATTSGTHAGVTITGNYDNTNPLFTNVSLHDYTLQAGSPAINTGYATGVTSDYAKAPRARNDIGAYAY